MTRKSQASLMTRTGQADPTWMGWAGPNQGLGRVMPDNLYWLSRLDDPDGPSGLNDSDKLSWPDNPYKLSRLDDLDGPCQTTRTDRGSLMTQMG